MKRILIASLGYATTGFGLYHVLFGDANIYGYTILLAGLIGVLMDINYKKLHTEQDSNGVK
ncbi:hypothetical protein [Paenibacillus tarimensis]|uniref:hypothetical protein n=1 Tax=Paenibacillus tarimensis TaxID=416012 RepID=UPI001F397700|nr:hypothetical protein [Paenibacillus tarimensis]MCF2942481.1 hypothetical protein [Paenibacillus tarimensis]